MCALSQAGQGPGSPLLVFGDMHGWGGAVPSTMAPGLQWMLASGCISGAWSPWDIYCIEGNCPSLYLSAGFPYSMMGWNNLVLLNQWHWSWSTDWQASALQPGCFVACIKLMRNRGKVLWWAPSVLLKGLPVCKDGGAEKTGWILSLPCSATELPCSVAVLQNWRQWVVETGEGLWMSQVHLLLTAGITPKPGRTCQVESQTSLRMEIPHLHWAPLPAFDHPQEEEFLSNI